MAHQIKVRLLENEDTPHVLALARLLNQHVYGDSREFDVHGAASFFTRCVTRPKSHFCAVAVFGMTPVAFAAAEIIKPYFSCKHIVRDVGVFVLPDFRSGPATAGLIDELMRFIDGSKLDSEIFLRGHGNADAGAALFGFTANGQIFQRESTQ